MKTYDFTKERWQDIIIPIDNTPCIHSNDNGHEEWQDWFHVKPWATDSLFYRIDRPSLLRKSWEVYSNE
jgi:hypothetical protein